MRPWVPLLAALILVAPIQAGHTNIGSLGWACGFGGSGQTGHPEDCGINPLGGADLVVGTTKSGDPSFSTNDWLPDDARVIGLEIGGQAKAYPIRMLNVHEIVNDVIGSEPVSVTFCPLCGSGLVFDRRTDIGGQPVTVDLSASGFLFRTDMVMWDPQTDTLWNQLTGQAIGWLDGRSVRSDHEDAHLTVLPSTLTTWGNWKDRHPGTLLLQPHFSAGSYREDVYNIESDCRHGLSSNNDCDVDGLHPKIKVMGHASGLAPDGVAFPIFSVAEDGGVATHKTAAGRTFVAVADVHGAATMYDGGTLDFVLDPDTGHWIDGDGVAWDLPIGRTVGGTTELPRLGTSVSFWFAWHDHYPDTDIWLPTGGGREAEEADPVLDQPMTWFALGGIAAVALAGIWRLRRGL